MRIHSASSINLYKQCPRKYYYRYIQKIPEPPSIYTVRGNIVHKVLEDFFVIDTSDITDYKKELPKKADTLLDKHWIKQREKLKELGLSIEELQKYYTDSRDMILHWTQRFITKVDETAVSFIEAFNLLKPAVEAHLKNEELGVQGFIDALYEKEDGLHIVDYKTSRKDDITPEYKLQAGIYAVLVHTMKNQVPKSIVFDFLKGEEKHVHVTQDLLKETLFEIEQIHVSTESTNRKDYPRKPSGLCKWKNARGEGQCAYFDICKPFDQ